MGHRNRHSQARLRGAGPTAAPRFGTIRSEIPRRPRMGSAGGQLPGGNKHQWDTVTVTARHGCVARGQLPLRDSVQSDLRFRGDLEWDPPAANSQEETNTNGTP